MPIIAIVIPVLHSSGAWIGYAGTGYLAGTLSSSWIGTFVLGNAGLLSTAGLVSAAGIAGASGALAGLGTSAAAAIGVGLTNVGLGGVASWLGIAPVATFLGITPLGWVIGGGTLAIASVMALLSRRVLKRINEERAKGGLEPTTVRQIVRDVREFEAQSMRDILAKLASECDQVSFDPHQGSAIFNGTKFSINRLRYTISNDGSESIAFVTKLGRSAIVFFVCGPKQNPPLGEP